MKEKLDRPSNAPVIRVTVLAFEEVPVRWASLSEVLQGLYELLRAHCSGLLVPVCCAPTGLGGAAFPEEGAPWPGDED